MNAWEYHSGRREYRRLKAKLEQKDKYKKKKKKNVASAQKKGNKSGGFHKVRKNSFDILDGKVQITILNIHHFYTK